MRGEVLIDWDSNTVLTVLSGPDAASRVASIAACFALHGYAVAVRDVTGDYGELRLAVGVKVPPDSDIQAVVNVLRAAKRTM